MCNFLEVTPKIIFSVYALLTFVLINEPRDFPDFLFLFLFAAEEFDEHTEILLRSEVNFYVFCSINDCFHQSPYFLRDYCIDRFEW